MTVKVKRLIVFGDSLSDIGVKRNTIAGKFASLFSLMRTNQVNRFSDNRNWTDFIWEWAGGSPLIIKDKATSDAAATLHLKWGKTADSGAAKDAPIYYVNYAEGGAMGGSDRFGAGLGTFKEQVDRYRNDLKSYPLTPDHGVGLYLIWFGLNDLVTNNRKAVDVAPVAKQIHELCEEIVKLDPNAAFLFGNLPNPQDAVRYMGKEQSAEVVDYATGALELGFELAKMKDEFGKGSNPAGIVDIYTKMYHVSRNLGSYGFTLGAQPKGIEVRYGAPPKDKGAAFRTTTSDEAHPTEEVYKVIAQIWAEEINEHFELGKLRDAAEAKFVVKGDN